MTDKNLQEVFTKIYDTKFWYNCESLSGAGSNLLYTENLRKELPKLFDIFNIKTVLDAPCGDMNWMRLVRRPITVPKVSTSKVLPNPGRPTSKACPPDSRAAMTRSTTAS